MRSNLPTFNRNVFPSAFLEPEGRLQLYGVFCHESTDFAAPTTGVFIYRKETTGRSNYRGLDKVLNVNGLVPLLSADYAWKTGQLSAIYAF